MLTSRPLPRREYLRRQRGSWLTRARLLFAFRPQCALVLFCDWPETFVNEFLHALSVIGLRGEDIAFRIGGDAVHAIKFARLASALAEGSENLKRIAQNDVHPVVLTVGKIDIGLLRILREGDIPGRPGTERPFLDECFLHERAIGLEHLNAVVRTVADVQQAVVRELRAVHRTPELLRRW